MVAFLHLHIKNIRRGRRRRLHDRKTEHFKALLKNDQSSACVDIDHVKATGHNILVSGKTDYRCKIKETLFIQEFTLSISSSTEKN